MVHPASGRLRDVIAVASVVAAVFLGALDQTVIVTVLPAVVSDLQIPFDNLDQAAWVVSGYLLGYTVALPLVGRLADVRGRRACLVGALAGFAAGSLGCALAPNLALLVAARLIQAVGGGALLPVATAVIADRYPPNHRAFAIGLVGAVAEAGGVVGPLYGAAVLTRLTWRWIFWLNLPVALILLVAIHRSLRDSRQTSDSLDLIGGGLVAVTLTGAILGLSHEALSIGGSDGRVPLLAAAVAALAGLIWRELQVSSPLLDLRLFQTREFVGAIIGGFLLGTALIVAMVNVPLYAATVLNADAAAGGLLLIRLTALIPVGALVGGLLGWRIGLPTPTALGFLIGVGGMVALSLWGTDPQPGLLWFSLGLTGLGFGMLIAPLSTLAVNFGGSGQEASAAALFSVARLTGMTIGLAALTSWGLARFDALAGAIPFPIPLPNEAPADVQKQLDAYNAVLVQVGAIVYHDLFLAGAAICAAGFVITVALGWGTPARATTGPER
jgi:EmrB/QacA subfamily drug resistance transporter